MPTRLLKLPLRPRFLPNVAIALGLLLAAWLSAGPLAEKEGEHLLLWLPSGLALGFLLRMRSAAAPGVGVGLVLGTLLLYCPAACSPLHPGLGEFVRSSPLQFSALLLRNLAEPALAYLLLRRKYWSNEFEHPSDVGVFVLNGVILVPTAATGIEVLFLLGTGQFINFGTHAWLELWSRMAAIGLCVPAITLFNPEEWRAMGRRTLATVLGILALGPAAVEFTFLSKIHDGLRTYPFGLVPFPLIAWITIGISTSVAQLVLAFMGCILCFATVHGGYFHSEDPIRMALTQDGFLSLLCLSTLLMGTGQRRRARMETLVHNALAGARIALWEWLPKQGLILHDELWAARFGTTPGKAVNPAALEGRIIAKEPPSILGGPGEQPLLEVGEEEEFRLKDLKGDWLWLRCRHLPSPPASAALRDARYGILIDLSEEKQTEFLRESALMREAQLTSLRHSVHPHFLFNALNTLRSLIASSPEAARSFVTRLAAFMRGTLAKTQENKVRFGDELELTRHYLEIEKVRFGERLDYEIDVTADCDPLSFPPMALQTLVENGVKYGISRLPRGGRIGIHARLLAGRLEVRVTNDGSLVETPPEATGTGLRNTRERLQLLFGDSARLTLDQLPGPKVEATISIDARKE